MWFKRAAVLYLQAYLFQTFVSPAWGTLRLQTQAILSDYNFHLWTLKDQAFILLWSKKFFFGRRRYPLFVPMKFSLLCSGRLPKQLISSLHTDFAYTQSQKCRFCEEKAVVKKLQKAATSVHFVLRLAARLPLKLVATVSGNRRLLENCKQKVNLTLRTHEKKITRFRNRNR